MSVVATDAQALSTSVRSAGDHYDYGAVVLANFGDVPALVRRAKSSAPIKPIVLGQERRMRFEEFTGRAEPMPACLVADGVFAKFGSGVI